MQKTITCKDGSWFFHEHFFLKGNAALMVQGTICTINNQPEFIEQQMSIGLQDRFYFLDIPEVNLKELAGIIKSNH